jgi:ATP-dependent DNA helicase RecQ
MSALVRHFGDTADGMKPCGHCDFCAPEMATAQSFREPDTGEERHLRAILQALASGQPKATGRLFTDLALGPDRREFDGYLDALSRAGLVSISQDTFTNAEGTVIHYKRATLTGEGREHTGGARTPLHVMLKETEAPSAGSGRAKKGGGSSRSGGVRAGGKAEREEAAASYSPEQKAVEARLREWRKAEAAKTGKPSFIVFSDSVLHALVVAQPRSIKSLLTVSGIGPEKADRYGAAIVALMTGAEVPGNFGEPVAAVKAAKPAKVKATSNMFASAREPRAVESRPAEVVVHRKRMAEAEPAESLTAEQQALDHRLREWRKVESERLGLPQFFVLGSSALRSIVLERPRNLGELEKIAGLGREKIDKYGAGILEVCAG